MWKLLTEPGSTTGWNEMKEGGGECRVGHTSVHADKDVIKNTLCYTDTHNNFNWIWIIIDFQLEAKAGSPLSPNMCYLCCQQKFCVIKFSNSTPVS